MRAYFQCSRHGNEAQACHRALVRRKLEEVEGTLSRLLQAKNRLEMALRDECASVEECAALLSRT
jgi:hypothetical protein